jgi:hypothetical protein
MARLEGVDGELLRQLRERLPRRQAEPALEHLREWSNAGQTLVKRWSNCQTQNRHLSTCRGAGQTGQRRVKRLSNAGQAPVKTLVNHRSNAGQIIPAPSLRAPRKALAGKPLFHPLNLSKPLFHPLNIFKPLKHPLNIFKPLIDPLKKGWRGGGAEEAVGTRSRYFIY